ncbi:MAG: DNA polymerase I [Chloroflexi bacterium]|nr:DNA polymerase I [Chloroflexota bacterium]MCL5076269.1 DNA polymerase I [Chloroflexota bacterium]
MKETLVLVDGNALFHRAFHALPPLTTSKGELVNAIYGFASMLLKVMAELKPAYVAVAFDKAAPTFRHRQFEGYKAQRPPAPEGLFDQFDRVHQLVSLLNIPMFEVEGYEADDVLGTLARQASQQDIDTVIVTGDTDALQLVGPKIRVLTSKRAFSDIALYDEEAVHQKYGLKPQQLPDFKSLKGDPSDNIPGVPGVGEKTAAKLLNQFGDLDGIYAHLDQIEPKLRARLEEHKELAYISKQLALIVTTIPIQLDLSTCRRGKYDRAQAMKFLRELEFRTLASKLPTEPEDEEMTKATTTTPLREGVKDSSVVQLTLFDELVDERFEARVKPLISPFALSPLAVKQPVEQGKYQVINSSELLQNLIGRLTNSIGLAIDLETSAKDAMRADIVGIAIALEPGGAYYIPVGHRPSLETYKEQPAQLPIELVLRKLRPILEDPSIAKYAHNGKYDLIVLSHHGLEIQGLAFDTMVAAYLLDPSRRTLNLKDLAWGKLELEMTPIRAIIGGGKTQISMADVPLEIAASYACADAAVTYRLTQTLAPELREADLWELFATVEIPLVPVLARMEQHGVAIDIPFLKQISRELHDKLAELEMRIYQEAGHRFNINSTQQLGSVLYEELKLPATRRTKTGYSTHADALKELQNVHPIIDLIIEYREMMKMKSTYVDALPLLIHPRTGRLHTSFNQTATTTGRLSSSDPNLQNIPIRTEVGRRVRRAFIADKPNHVLLSADYSQIELRILAHICQDQRLLAAFAAKEDIHAATAAEIFDVPLERVTPEMRRLAKIVNFGIIYGISDYGLSASAGIPRPQAAQYISNYIEKYNGVSRYVERTKRWAEEKGYVTTLLGRRRYLPEIRAAHRGIKMAAEREAINMPIQGTAADIIKIAMIRLDQTISQRRLKSRMILQVHDELLFEIPLEELDEMKHTVKSMMENALPLSVPVEVELKVGPNWDEMGRIDMMDDA